MSTDLYGVRVLSIGPEQLRLRFKVFLVNYDTAGRSHPPVPDDAGFFFHLLWQRAVDQRAPVRSAPLARLVERCAAIDTRSGFTTPPSGLRYCTPPRVRNGSPRRDGRI